MDCEKIITHITDFFSSLYTTNEWVRPSLNNLVFNSTGEEEATWLEREFEEAEVREAVFNLEGDKAPGPDGFRLFFVQRFWSDLKEDFMEFLEFYTRGRLSKNLCASFITLIPKKEGAAQLKDFRPISPIGSIYKVLAKVLVNRLQKVLPMVISPSQGAFVIG